MTIRALQPGSIAAKGIAIIALAMGLAAFLLGSAPFTAALFLAVVAIPLAVAAFLLHAKRLAGLACYWAAAALLTNQVSQLAGAEVDVILSILGVAGAVLSLILYLGHRQALGASRDQL